MTKRALLYARQSIEREEGDRSLSIESQLDTLRDHCQRADWHVAGEIRESGLKGWMDADERPGLADAIRRAEAAEYDVLLVWDLSRLARSVRLQEQLVWQFTPLGIEIVSHTEPESSDALIRQIKGAVNEYRTREIRANVRRALRTRTANGWHQGRVPWGYSRPQPKGPLVIDPEPAELVRGIYEQRLAGSGPAAIADGLNGRGIASPRGSLWSTSQVMTLLARISYRGAVRSGEDVIEDAHEAIVPLEVWLSAQRQPGRHAPRQKAVSSPYEGLIEHACGEPMYLIQACGRMPSPLFRCRRSGHRPGALDPRPCAVMPRAVHLAHVEAAIWQAIMDDFRRLRAPQTVFAEAKRDYARLASGGAAEARQRAEGQRRQALAQRERAVELYLRGAIDRARFDAEDAQALARLAETERQLAVMPEPPDKAAIDAEWEQLRGLRRTLRQYGPTERGQVLRTLGVAVVHSGECVTIRYRPGIAAYLGER